MLFFDEIVLCHREPGVLVRRTLTQALVVSTEVTWVNKLMMRIVVHQAIYTSISLCAFHEKVGPCQECFALSMSSSLFSRSAKPPLSRPFHPHSYVSDIRSVQVGRSRFSRRCHLISVLCFSL